MATGPTMVDSVEAALSFCAAGGSEIRVDLSQVTFIDARGYSALVELYRVAVERGAYHSVE